MNPSLTVKVGFRARNVHIDRPSDGDPGKACQAGRSWRSGSGITGGQTSVAHHEAFVERLIGTVRREYLDRTLFWNRGDLERKLDN